MRIESIRVRSGGLWLLAAAIFLLSSCTDKTPQTPEGVYQAFYAAAAKADWDTAVSLLDPRAVGRFEAVGARLAAMVEFDGKPLDLFLQQVKGERATPLRKVEVVERHPGSVKLRVTAGKCGQGEACSVSDVEMIRRAGRWLVSPEVPEMLEGLY